MSLYHVTTEERSYNSVSNPEQFIKVRNNWRDFSPVREAFRWDKKKQQWVPAGQKQFEYHGQVYQCSECGKYINKPYSEIATGRGTTPTWEPLCEDCTGIDENDLTMIQAWIYEKSQKGILTDARGLGTERADVIVARSRDRKSIEQAMRRASLESGQKYFSKQTQIYYDSLLEELDDYLRMNDSKLNMYRR